MQRTGLDSGGRFLSSVESLIDIHHVAGVHVHSESSCALPFPNVGRDVQQAIDRIWLDGIVELSLDPDELAGCRRCRQQAATLHR